MFNIQYFIFLFIILLSYSNAHADAICSIKDDTLINQGESIKIIFSNFYVAVVSDNNGEKQTITESYYDDYDSFSYHSMADSKKIDFQLFERSTTTGWDLILNIKIDLITGNGEIQIRGQKLRQIEVSDCNLSIERDLKTRSLRCNDTELSVALAVHAVKDILKYSSEKMDTYFASHKKIKETYHVFVDTKTNVQNSSYVVHVRISDCKITHTQLLSEKKL